MQTFEFLGIAVAGTREVPADVSVLGAAARAGMPFIVQVTLRRPAQCRTERSFDALLYTAKQLTRTRLKACGGWLDLFFVSLSTRTVVYKALCRGSDLDRFYPDLANPRFKTRFCLLHRRFSTNTRSAWDKAQPFRHIAHNGEINTIAGNRSWAYAREAALGLAPDELLTHADISDSGSLNEMIEALRSRSSIPHLDDILAILMPPAEGGCFYEFWGRAVEPWDGPALVAYSDGETVGARLDRNGWRCSASPRRSSSGCSRRCARPARRRSVRWGTPRGRRSSRRSRARSTTISFRTSRRSPARRSTICASRWSPTCTSCSVRGPMCSRRASCSRRRRRSCMTVRCCGSASWPCCARSRPGDPRRCAPSPR